MKPFIITGILIIMAGCKPSGNNSCLIRSQGDLNKLDQATNNTDISTGNETMTTKKNAKIEVLDRDKIEKKYKWDPSILFKSDEEWKTELKAVREAITPTAKDKKLKKYEGKLGGSTKSVKAILDSIWNMKKRIEKLYFYASRVHDEDMRKSEGSGMTENAKKLYSDFEIVTSYMEPEFLKLGVAKLKKLGRSKLLKDYSRYFHNLIRIKDHVLSKKEEHILSLSGILGFVSYDTYSTFSNSDMEFPQIVDHEKNKVKLSASMYAKYRASLDRSDRKKVFLKFWGTYKKYRNTYAHALSGQVKYYTFAAKARKYPDALTAALYPKNIPNSYYTNLISSINSNLDAFQDYLKLRKKILGIKGKQEYYDIYPPLVKNKPQEISIENGKKIVKEALKPLGAEYAKLLTKAFKSGSGWLDVFPNKGKRSGAYMDGMFGYHPFVLLNYNNNFNSVSTLAHEIGHAMHSVLSSSNQPYPKSDYVILNAEVASIVNETLLIEYMLKKEKDPERKQFLLSYYLDSFRGTVFRQTMFAEFELKMYEAYQKGTALTADFLDSLYLNLLRKYHGHDKNIMNIDPLYSVEWAYIPHFYYNFYVYSYVNGFVAATVLADKILKNGPKAAQKYINGLLKAGGSKDPLDILKDAGVDMLSPATYKAASDKFRARVKELDALVSK